MPTTTPGSSNPFPSVLLVEGSAPATPSSGKWRLFVDVADGLLKLKDDAGTVTAVGGAGGVADLDALLALSSGQDTSDALTGAAAPDAANVFATMADVGGGGGSLTVSEAVLSGDVTMTSPGTWYDGPSLSLAAGTYVCWWKVVFGIVGSLQVYPTVRLLAGATVIDEAEGTNIVAGYQHSLSGAGTCVLGSTTTVKIVANDGRASQIMRRDTPDNDSGAHYATHLVALKIA